MARRRKPQTPYFHLTARLNLKHQDQATAAEYLRKWLADGVKVNPEYSQKDLLVDIVLTLANEHAKPTRRDMVTRLGLMIDEKFAQLTEIIQTTAPRRAVDTYEDEGGDEVESQLLYGIIGDHRNRDGR